MEKTVVGRATTSQKKIEQLTPYLRIQSPNNESQRLRLHFSNLTIGRDASCDIVLDDEMISREHCKIWLDTSEKVNFEDLNSTNGSKIDGEKITRGVLLPHNRLKIGNHTIKVEYKDSEEIRREELLEVAATSDPLTGVSNRKWFEERVNQLLLALADKDHYMAIVMVDIDHFKKVNDTYGHQTGDIVIKGIAEILNACKRQQDLLARYGGEEFVLCLPDSTPSNTSQFCERVREQIASTDFRFGQEQIKITASLGGCANIITQDSSLYKMTSLADEALYSSKNSGRNQTTIANSS